MTVAKRILPKATEAPREKRHPKVGLAITCAVACVVVVVSAGYLAIARDEMVRQLVMLSAIMEAILLVAMAASGPRVLLAPPRLRALVLTYAVFFGCISGVAIAADRRLLIEPLRDYVQTPFNTPIRDVQ